MFGSLVPAFLVAKPDRRRQARHTAPTLKVRINGKRYRTTDWSLLGFRLDDFDGICACGEQIRGVVLFKGCRGEVVAETLRLGPGKATGFRVLEISSNVFLKMSVYS